MVLDWKIFSLKESKLKATVGEGEMLNPNAYPPKH